MKELLNILNKHIQRSYPETCPNLEMVVGSTKTLDRVIDKESIHAHAVLTLTYTMNKDTIVYRLISISYKTCLTSKEDILSIIVMSLKDSLLNNLLFSIGSLNIADLLSGNVEPENQ